MVDLIQTTKGAAIFLLGAIYMYISYIAIPPIAEAIASIAGFTNNDLLGIVWLFLFATWILFTIIIPVMMMYTGLIMQDINEPAPSSILQAIVFLIFGLIFTYLSWYIYPNIAAIYTEPFTKGIYWVGLFTTWLTIFLIAPIMKIIQSYPKTQ